MGLTTRPVGRGDPLCLDRINRLTPERVHKIVTAGVEQMARVLIAGADRTTGGP